MVIEANLVTAQIPFMANAQESLLSSTTLSEMRPEKIGQRLKLLREALGYTPSQISDELGIERTYWSRFENARRPVNDTTAALLVERYGVTLDFIVLGRWDKLPLDLASRMRSLLEKNN